MNPNDPTSRPGTGSASRLPTRTPYSSGTILMMKRPLASLVSRDISWV